MRNEIEKNKNEENKSQCNGINDEKKRSEPHSIHCNGTADIGGIENRKNEKNDGDTETSAKKIRLQ